MPLPRLIVSDVDGTLVTRDKILTPEAIAAVHELHARGILFSAVSSRPPFGMRMLIEPLQLKLPMGAFNGATTFAPDLSITACQHIPRDAAMSAIEMLDERGVDVWFFTNDRWFVRDGAGINTDRERRTIVAEPTVVPDFSAHLDHACKIVGVSDDHALLARCEPEIRLSLGKAAHAARSQPYYLDITPPGHDKGTFVETLSNSLGIPLSDVITIGDMTNDLPMFRKSGRSIAMGNATDDIKSHATGTTASNEENGFAQAIRAILADT